MSHFADYFNNYDNYDKYLQYRDYCEKLDRMDPVYPLDEAWGPLCKNLAWQLKYERQLYRQNTRDKNGWILKQYGLRNCRNVKRSTRHSSRHSKKSKYSSDLLNY